MHTQDLRWLLPAFAEDVTRILEREVRDIQRHVLTLHPEAAYVSGLSALMRPICMHACMVGSKGAQAGRQADTGS